MSSRSHKREEGAGLFDDLPLQEKPRPRQAPATPRQRRAATRLTKKDAAEHLPLFPETERTEKVAVTPPSPSPRRGSVAGSDAVTRPARHPIVPFYAHLRAGAMDLAVVLAVMLVTWIGLASMGVDLDVGGLVPLTLFLLPFSFLYLVFPLAFWGRTPGMAQVGIVARSRDGQTLSFKQAALRWASAVLCVLTLGLPLLLTAVSGQTLADRISGSQTLPAR